MGGWEPGPGSEICYGRVGVQTNMQPSRVSKFVVKVWMMVLCLIVLGSGWGGSWDKFQGVYSFYDCSLLKAVVFMITCIVLIRYSKGLSRLGISVVLLKKIVRWLITGTKIGCTVLIHNGTERNKSQKTWHTK